jgi:hypothetical protein
MLILGVFVPMLVVIWVPMIVAAVGTVLLILKGRV